MRDWAFCLTTHFQLLSNVRPLLPPEKDAMHRFAENLPPTTEAEAEWITEKTFGRLDLLITTFTAHIAVEV